MARVPLISQIEVVDEDVAAILRKKTPAERLELVWQANRTARLILSAQIQRNHPDWDEAAVTAEVARRMLGGTT